MPKGVINKAYAKRGTAGIGIAVGEDARRDISTLVDSKSSAEPIMTFQLSLGNLLRRVVEEGLAATKKVQKEPEKYPSLTKDDAISASEGFKLLKDVAPSGPAPSTWSFEFTENGLAMKTELKGDWSFWSLLEKLGSDEFNEYGDAIMKLIGFGSGSEGEKATTVAAPASK